MRHLIACTVIFLSGITAFAQPPKLEIESIIEAKGDYVSFTPDTDAVTVAYIGKSGIDPFPSQMLKDSKSFILPVRGLKEADYDFTAIAIKNNDFTRRDFSVRVGHAPNPPPGPQPDPGPTPGPTPKPPDPKLDDAPVTTDGLHVAIIYQSGQQVTQGQFNVMYGATTRNYLNENCDRLSSQPQWRILSTEGQALTEPWKDIIKRKKTDVPGLVIISGKKYVYEGKLPDSPEEFNKLIDKYKPTHRTDHCPTCPAPYTFQKVELKKG